MPESKAPENKASGVPFSSRFAFAIQNLKSRFGRDGGHSSMVELQIVILAVAGSSPVGHPIPLISDFDLDLAHAAGTSAA